MDKKKPVLYILIFASTLLSLGGLLLILSVLIDVRTLLYVAVGCIVTSFIIIGVCLIYLSLKIKNR